MNKSKIIITLTPNRIFKPVKYLLYKYCSNLMERPTKDELYCLADTFNLIGGPSKPSTMIIERVRTLLSVRLLLGSYTSVNMWVYRIILDYDTPKVDLRQLNKFLAYIMINMPWFSCTIEGCIDYDRFITQSYIHSFDIDSANRADNEEDKYAQIRVVMRGHVDTDYFEEMVLKPCPRQIHSWTEDWQPFYDSSTVLTPGQVIANEFLQCSVFELIVGESDEKYISEYLKNSSAIQIIEITNKRI